MESSGAKVFPSGPSLSSFPSVQICMETTIGVQIWGEPRRVTKEGGRMATTGADILIDALIEFKELV